MLAIEAAALRKDYGDLVAVNEVSFTVAAGESFAVLGPNGAGKSTLIRLLTTLLLPTSGSAKVAGYDVVASADDVRRAIGVVPQAVTSDPKLTAAENLEFSARLHGIPRSGRRKLIDELLGLVDLMEWRDKLVGTFSGGMRRRVEIARSLVHEPQIMFLDEPTSGLDPASRLAMWDMLRRMRQRRPLTLLLTTHYMEEAEAECDRVAIVDHGHIVAAGRPAELKALLPSAESIEVAFAAAPPDWAEILERLPGVASLDTHNGTFRLRCSSRTQALPALLEATAERQVTVTSIAVHENTLQDVFIHFTGRELRDATKRLRLDDRLLHG